MDGPAHRRAMEAEGEVIAMPTLKDVLAHLQLLGSGQESPYSHAEMIAVVGGIVEGQEAMERSRAANEERARNPLKSNLRVQQHMYLAMDCGQWVHTTAYLEEYHRGDACEYWVIVTHAPNRGGRKLKLKAEKAEAAELKAKLKQILTDAAREAGWDVITYTNEFKVQVTRYFPPWSTAERPTPDEETV